MTVLKKGTANLVIEVHCLTHVVPLEPHEHHNNRNEIWLVEDPHAAQEYDSANAELAARQIRGVLPVREQLEQILFVRLAHCCQH